MANLVETTVSKILGNAEFKRGEEFGNKNIQTMFNVSKTTAAKALKSLKDSGLVTEGSKKGKYVLVAQEVSETDETENEVNEVSEAPASEGRSSEDPCIEQTFEVYLNGSYLTTITAPLNELIAEVRASNPNATLESVDGNEAYFVKQKGTKA
jgi:DNA-binding transcriptional ArsR family regulator